MLSGTVQRIFRRHYGSVEATHRLDERSRWAALNILTCRTAAQGHHVDECPNGDYRVRLPNSCKHRACPLCGATETELWLERQSAKELRCAHHQIVFTSPDGLRAIWRWNRKLFTNLYFRAAWHALRELLGDARRLGVTPGVIAVFQSWGEELREHLHLHFIEKLDRARSQLGQPAYEPEVRPPDTHELLHRMFPDFKGDLCPNCGARLVTVSVTRPGRSPPREVAA